MPPTKKENTLHQNCLGLKMDNQQIKPVKHQPTNKEMQETNKASTLTQSCNQINKNKIKSQKSKTCSPRESINGFEPL